MNSVFASLIDWLIGLICDFCTRLVWRISISFYFQARLQQWHGSHGERTGSASSCVRIRQQCLRRVFGREPSEHMYAIKMCFFFCSSRWCFDKINLKSFLFRSQIFLVYRGNVGGARLQEGRFFARSALWLSSRAEYACSIPFHLLSLYYPVISCHFFHSLGNYTRRAIFPEMCKINQSIKHRHSW